MKLSKDRILTTHVGSLPRPDDLFELMLARMDGKPVDEAAYAARVRKAVADSVKQQADAGLDIVSDGEMGKPSFITYASQRLDGLEKREGNRPSPFSNTRETRDFPEYYQSQIAEQHERLARHDQSDYVGLGTLGDELAGLEASVAELETRWLEVSEALEG